VKIASVTTKVISMPGSSLGFSRPLGNVTRRHRSLDYVIATVTSLDGSVGVGYAFTPGYGAEAIRAIVDNDLSQLIVGQDPTDHEALWLRMWKGTNYFGRQGAVLFGMCAVDVACWDLDARRRGTPLWQLLGGTPEPIQTYVTFGFISLTVPELQQLAGRFAEEGFSRMKLMVGQPDIEDDLARVKAVREVVGDQVELVLDANQAWPDLKTALPRARRLAELGIGWLEEPVPADDVRGLAELRRRLDVPVAGGENAYTWLQARKFLEREAVDIFQPDIYRMGGLTEQLRVCRRVAEAGVRVSPHHVPELNVHVLSALSGDRLLEYLPFFQDPFLAERSPIEKGAATPSEAPGHGIRFAPAGDLPRCD